MSETLQLNYKTQNLYEFEIEVEGIKPTNITAWFVIKTEFGELSFACVNKNNKFETSIPELPFIKDGEYIGAIRIVMQGYFFEPISDIAIVAVSEAAAKTGKIKNLAKKDNSVETNENNDIVAGDASELMLNATTTEDNNNEIIEDTSPDSVEEDSHMEEVQSPVEESPVAPIEVSQMTITQKDEVVKRIIESRRMARLGIVATKVEENELPEESAKTELNTRVSNILNRGAGGKTSQKDLPKKKFEKVTIE